MLRICRRLGVQRQDVVGGQALRGALEGGHVGRRGARRALLRVGEHGPLGQVLRQRNVGLECEEETMADDDI